MANHKKPIGAVLLLPEDYLLSDPLCRWNPLIYQTREKGLTDSNSAPNWV